MAREKGTKKEKRAGTGRSANVKEVATAKWIAAMAAHLKREGKLELPKYLDLIKTAPFKELSPYDPDWVFVRAAALIRRLYIRPGQGVGAMTKVFGGPSRRGTCPQHHTGSARGIIRYCFQQLEGMGVVEQCDNGGRRLTPEGQRTADLIAHQTLFPPQTADPQGEAEDDDEENGAEEEE